ncbi:hypothetical protein Runsl_2828 [Runella slithyformis DSM 19594]|uniref:Uncharacterized protein n=1 Tax=Runella slithyformis (strain ATCC 29530 / DSM 19594 / LMG 11500 / NCIMB 11436 / LSU 4) TaxID=761193 RepID=A0A7U3ZL42_RUNSL|nr:hypothetical protein Runsl_2828 [Runella slithyformis DSM 19594]
MAIVRNYIVSIPGKSTINKLTVRRSYLCSSLKLLEKVQF